MISPQNDPGKRVCTHLAPPAEVDLISSHTHTCRRYKDAHLKTEFDNMALRNDSAIFDEEEEEGDDSLVVANRLASDSEEEINTGEVRQ